MLRMEGGGNGTVLAIIQRKKMVTHACSRAHGNATTAVDNANMMNGTVRISAMTSLT